MSDTDHSDRRVDKATEADLAFILGWLEREEAEDGFGFWCNRQIISNALREEANLWVIRHNGEAVAFQVGNYAADIVSIRKDHRKTGLGTILFQASFDRAMRDGVNVLEGQCAPETSLGFWQRMGFEQYHDRYRPNEVRVRRVLHRFFDLPTDAPRADVIIEFFPERAIYGDGSLVASIAHHHLTGARLEDGTIMLDRRVIGLTDEEPERADLAVRIEIDGDERCFCKAKYGEASAVGVVHDWSGGAFYIDFVKPV